MSLFALLSSHNFSPYKSKPLSLRTLKQLRSRCRNSLLSYELSNSASSTTFIMSATAPLPLTTSFSPPAACTTDTWYIEYLSGTNYYNTEIEASDSGWWLSQGPTDWSSCFPSGYATNTNSYFSPGVCPSGYWIADQSVDSINDNIETRATCCPE